MSKKKTIQFPGDSSDFEAYMAALDPEKELSNDEFYEAFKRANVYFKELNTILMGGSETEKKAAIEKFMNVKSHIDSVMNRMLENSGISREEVLELLQKEQNFSQEQWEILSEARADMEKSTEELKSMVKEQKKAFKNSVEKNTAASKTKAKKKPRGKWMKS
ncbi:MAG: hypothetical protein MRY21_04820 [Simkaniaceae bacterium]|nr:hypothetical protein [Simkaniaceae bacterium]